ncbi:MAG: TetR/AcrR family transcriptional regulator [Novosphingobium sp.]|nr:TetR/AcrR family transcriptional regulator [Novosphingobium sp.]
MVNRRIGKEDSESREILLQAAEHLMKTEGYAAVTSRKLSSHAGLKPQLVHYYFRTMDELFETLFQRVAERHLASLREIADGKDRLPRMFQLSCDTENAVLHLEFLALANHRKSLHQQIAEFGQELNRIESNIFVDVLAQERIELVDVTPQELATIFETVARGMAFAGGFNASHFTNARKVLTNLLSNFGTTYKILAEITAAE